MRIAIIGAGMAGLTAARRLRDHGDVVIFDKSRGVGGRMSTRYAGEYEFDHGAQYFTVTDPEFQAVIDGHAADNRVGRWEATGLYLKRGLLEADRGRPRWVGTSRMNSLPKGLAEGLDVRLGARVAHIEGAPGVLSLVMEDGSRHGPFDHVLSSVPAPQAAALLPTGSPLQATLADVAMHACFALMVGFPKDRTDFDPGWESLRVQDLPVSWIAVNSAKPGRNPDHIALVIHGSPEWSDRHAEADRRWVQETMLDCASALCGVRLDQAPHIALHRWLYAYADKGVGSECLTDPVTGTVLAGDWCVGGRVEGAFVSGRAAAHRIIGAL